ncbi:unnamed protein product, partial [Protopolystoma xenopodis]
MLYIFGLEYLTIYLPQTASRQAADNEIFTAFRRVRVGLDRARLVIDMVLKRERRKLALVKRLRKIADIQLSLIREGKNSTNIIDADWNFFSTAHIGASVYDNADLWTRLSLRLTSLGAPFLPEKTDTMLTDPQISAAILMEERIKLESASSQPQEVSESSALGDHHNAPPCINTWEPVVEPLIGAPEIIQLIPPHQLVLSLEVRRRLRSALVGSPFRITCQIDDSDDRDRPKDDSSFNGTSKVHKAPSSRLNSSRSRRSFIQNL